MGDMDDHMLDPNMVVQIVDNHGSGCCLPLQDAWGFACKRSWDRIVAEFGKGDEGSIPKRWEADHDERYRIWKEKKDGTRKGEEDEDKDKDKEKEEEEEEWRWDKEKGWRWDDGEKDEEERRLVCECGTDNDGDWLVMKGSDSRYCMECLKELC